MNPSLLAAVCAAPYEDAPRLAYADALSRQTPPDPLGEYVRLSVRLAAEASGDQLEDEAWLGRMDALERVARLAELHEADWKRPVLAIAERCVIDRGLVAGVRLPAATFLSRADELFALAPIVHVDLTDVRPHLAALASSDRLRRVRALSIENQRLASDDVALLAASPHLVNVWCLELRGNAIDMDGFRAILRSPHLKGLRHAELDDNAAKVHEVASVMGGEVQHSWFPLQGEELEKEFGPIPWLHCQGGTTDGYPPSRYRLPPS